MISWSWCMIMICLFQLGAGRHFIIYIFWSFRPSVRPSVRA
jgi:hypothetical protein